MTELRAETETVPLSTYEMVGVVAMAAVSYDVTHDLTEMKAKTSSVNGALVGAIIPL
jgi:hypothetical protein